MQRNGDLVLRTSSGHVVWQSHTHGHGFYLQLQNNGNAVIRNPHHGYEWSTGTTATILLGGRTLAAGGRLVNRYRQQFHITPTYLTMQANGDLWLRWGSRRTWHSGTHSPGAHMIVSPAGRVEIISTRGDLVWRSPTVGRDPELFIDQCGDIELTSFHHARPTWNPTHRQPTCGD